MTSPKETEREFIVKFTRVSENDVAAESGRLAITWHYHDSPPYPTFPYWEPSYEFDGECIDDDDLEAIIGEAASDCIREIRHCIPEPELLDAIHEQCCIHGRYKHGWVQAWIVDGKLVVYISAHLDGHGLCESKINDYAQYIGPDKTYTFRVAALPEATIEVMAKTIDDAMDQAIWEACHRDRYPRCTLLS